MSKFKVGEKVKVKKCNFINIPIGAIGTVAEINSVGSAGAILVKFDQNFKCLHNGLGQTDKQYSENKYYFLTEGYLEKLKTETIVIYRKGDETIALDKRTGEKAIAKCNSREDAYDFKTGAKIALARLMQDKSKLSDLKPESVFVAGKRRFIVLEQFENTTAVAEIGKLEIRKFDSISNNWATSDLREYLNTEVLTVYEYLFGEENIVEAESDLTSLDGLEDYGKSADKIRIMTFEERRKYQSLYEREEEWEWLLTPWSTPKRGWESAICAVSPMGYFSGCDCSIDCAVRPFCILKSNIFVSAV